MKKLLQRSFARRISAYIISLIIIIFCAIMIVFYRISSEQIITSSIRYADSMLSNMAQQIDKQLQTVAHSIENTAWMIETNMSDTDSIKNILQHNMQNTPLIVGSSITYAPKVINNQEKLKMFYASRTKNGITFDEKRSQDYYYPDMDWFKIPKLTKKSGWSEPYFDKGAGNIIMTTYSRPLINSKGKVYAIYTADVSLLSLTDLVEEIEPFPGSYSFMLSRNGYYLTHRKQERVLRETIFSVATTENDSVYAQIGHAMQTGKAGHRLFDNDGDLSYAIYAPVSNIGWSICSVSKKEIVLADLNTTTRSIVIVFIAGIICFFLMSLLIIKRLMKPLEGFTASAKEIAHGNFKARLPEIKSEDEMKELHNSFVYMQQSLTTYIAELQKTTIAKERIQSELHIAHEIQMGMIPKIFPPFPERSDIDLYAILKPAKEVGGDLYDFFIMDEKLYFTIGDVSGKGIPASLFMAVTRSLFRNISGYIPSPQEIVTRMNDSISEQNEANMFVTLFVGVLDLKNGQLSYCNAGHNPPIIIQPNGSTFYMEVKRNLPVGLIKDFNYVEEKIVLDKGVKLFCYTDGVVEAENESQELYTEEKLENLLSNHSQDSAQQIIEQVLESITIHAAAAEQSDDLTILVVTYK